MEKKSRTSGDYLTIGALLVAGTIGSFLGATQLYAAQKKHELRKWDLCDYIQNEHDGMRRELGIEYKLKTQNNIDRLMAIGGILDKEPSGEEIFKHFYDQDPKGYTKGKEFWEITRAYVEETRTGKYRLVLEHENKSTQEKKEFSIPIKKARYTKLIDRYGEGKVPTLLPPPIPTPRPTVVARPTPTPTPTPTGRLNGLYETVKPKAKSTPTPTPTATIPPPPPEPDMGGDDDDPYEKTRKYTKKQWSRHIRKLQQNRRKMGGVAVLGVIIKRLLDDDDDDDDDNTGHNGTIGGNNPVREGNR